MTSRTSAMLSIAKLRVGQEAYQLSGVAQSLDDYYTGVGEAIGQWVGGGAARLGLDGHVSPDDLRAVLAGLRPGTGGLTPNSDELRVHPRRVPGFDLTFKVPKSASVLYAVSDDPRVQGAVIDAGEAAMRSAIGWLEREAIRVQRGSHNLAYLARLDPRERALAGPRRLPTSGVVAASFRHRTSRAGDPLLHWHVLVANLVEGSDGRWSSAVHPEIYRHARAAGEVFQATFRAELTRTLGIEWRPGRHVPEIAGIPQAMLDMFSKRSNDIDAWLSATGTPNTPEGRQAAVLATRRHKPEVEHQRLDSAWKVEADVAGWGPLMADGLIAASSDRLPVDYTNAWRLETTGLDENGNVDTYERTVTADEWITDLLRRDLTSDHSTFTHVDLTQAVAARLQIGATIDTIERVARRVIGSPHVIALTAFDRPAQWTSRELFDVEQQFLAALDQPMAEAVSADSLGAVIASRPNLGNDQRQAVQTLCTATSAISVLVGPAGTGKTYTLDTVRAAFESAGIEVRGAAPSARAALELAGATGMRTSTLHSVLASYQRGDNHPTAGSLLVIDEAGMADIRILTQIIATHTVAGGRVILAGDHHQLPEIGAGGGFEHAAQHARTVAELTENRRQQHDWERVALAELRDGNVAFAVKSYVENGRLAIAPTPADLVTHAIELWSDARQRGLNPILLAGTNDLVDQLNTGAINHLISTGELAVGTPTRYGETALRVGERVVLRRNSSQERLAAGDITFVANGQAGTVTAIEGERVQVGLDNGPTVELDRRYLQRGGHISHGYALTSHRAQGGTWDLAIAVGADTLYREAAYVQLSRGTHANQILLTDPEMAILLADVERDTVRHDQGITHPDDEPAVAEEHLISRLHRSGAKHLAHTIDPDIAVINHLATTLTLTELDRRAQNADYAEHIASTTHGHTRTDLESRSDRLIHVANHIALGHAVSPADRHNVGSVIAVDDAAGAVTIHFTSHEGREAERVFTWDQIRIIEPTNPEPRRLSPIAEATVQEMLVKVHAAIDEWDQTVASFDAQPDDRRRFGSAALRVVEQAASRIAAERTDWLTHLLGPRPHDVAGSRTWDNAVNAVARFQLTHADSETPSYTADAQQLRVWLGQTRLWLATTDRTHEAPATLRTIDALLDRRQQLDDHFAAAPTDYRYVIDQLQAGQLTFEDTSELLAAAVDQQALRREWIIENWPHIVEYQEINRALTVGATMLPDIVERQTLERASNSSTTGIAHG